ncbi:MAG: FtsX-like permease family protein, partial [Candidatus Heimdallarchaeota archaeon]
EKGSYFSSNPSDEVILETRFAEQNNIKEGDIITLNYGPFKFEPTVVGLAFSPEYKYVVNPNTGFAEKGYFSPLWMPIEEIYKVLGINDVFNELLIQVIDYTKLDQTISEIQKHLSNEDVNSIAIRGTDELDYVFMEEDISSVGEFSVAIGVIILFVAIFIIYDALTKIITSQKTLIGIMRALGGNSKELLQHYVSFGVILSIIGIIIGIPLGFLFMYLLTDEFAKIIGLTFIASDFKIQPFFTPVILTLVVTILSSIFAVYRIVNISPVEAMTNQTIKKDFTKTYPSEKIFDLLSGKRKFSTKIPVRQVLRRKRRSILTAFTIAVTALLVLASYGFMNSFFYQLDVYYTDNVQYQFEGRLDQPYNLDDFNPILQSLTEIKQYEGMISQPVMAVS